MRTLLLAPYFFFTHTRSVLHFENRKTMCQSVLIIFLLLYARIGFIHAQRVARRLSIFCIIYNISKHVEISRDSQLNHWLSQYTSKRSGKHVAACLQGYPRATYTCNLSSQECQNVFTLVSFKNNRNSGIDPRHPPHL